MHIEVVGNTVYDLITKYDPPLTDAQTEALIVEYAKLGLHYKKSKWKGNNCIIIKTSPAEFIQFHDKLVEDEQYKAIRMRVGYSGLICSTSNTYLSGYDYCPTSDWENIVAFIEDKYSSASSTTTPKSIQCPRQKGIFENLLADLEYGDDLARYDAAVALGRLGDKRAIEPLIRVLVNSRDPFGSDQASAAGALGKLGDKRAIKPLTEALKSEHPHVQSSAREALEKIRKRQVYDDKDMHTDQKPADIKCPVCGAETTLRIAKKGLNEGKTFHVCVKYPECKGRVQKAL